jgi:hypothetical protein
MSPPKSPSNDPRPELTDEELNSIGDGLEPETETPDLEDVDRDYAIDAMRRWFFENYEDPAQHMPYESREGGYQYIWGGPFDVEEVIRDNFEGHVPEDWLIEAIANIQRDGYEWVPAINRVRGGEAPEYDDPEEPQDGELGQRPRAPTENEIAALEAQLAELVARATQQLDIIAPRTPGPGHNFPPEGINDLPLGPNAIVALRVDLNDLGGLRAKLSQDRAGAVALVGRITETAKQVGAYCAALGDRAAKNIADKAGDIALEYAKYGFLGELLIQIVRLAEKLIDKL